MSDLAARRRFYAEEIQAVANLRSAALIEALAAVPRERFLPPGPWTIRGEGDFQGAPRQTPDADPRHLYHNVAVAIAPARTLFNGAPSAIAMAIDALALVPGARVMHLGTGLGYYTALAAHCVGASGHVLGIEVDTTLASGARQNLREYGWVEVREGDGTAGFDGPFDAILVNAGVTHPLPAWLDALTPGGRMVIPVTATAPGMATIGKGPLILVTRVGAESYAAKTVGFVAIYSAVGIRSEAANVVIGQTLARSPFAPLASLRRETHAADASCWLHLDGCCFSTAASH